MDPSRNYIDHFLPWGITCTTRTKDRRLVLDGCTPGPIGEIINPENTLVYIIVNGRELEEGLYFDNHQYAMVIADLCSEFLRHGVDPSRISVLTVDLMSEQLTV